MYSGNVQIFKDELALYQGRVLCPYEPSGVSGCSLCITIIYANKILLQGLLGGSGSSSRTNQGTDSYIKKKISKKVLNRFHSLNESNEPSLVEEVQH